MPVFRILNHPAFHHATFARDTNGACLSVLIQRTFPLLDTSLHNTPEDHKLMTIYSPCKLTLSNEFYTPDQYLYHAYAYRLGICITVLNEETMEYTEYDSQHNPKSDTNQTIIVIQSKDDSTVHFLIVLLSTSVSALYLNGILASGSVPYYAIFDKKKSTISQIRAYFTPPTTHPFLMNDE